MQTILSKNWLLIAAIWYAINGILHDVFVIRNHKGGYDRELLRLLMDGHVLILSVLVMMTCYLMTACGIIYGPVTAIIVTVAMLVYCAMIFPFLKSFGTIFMSLMALAACLNSLWGNH